jgi:Uma2 family endonuclease
MSTITPTPPMAQPADPDWIPEPLGRLTLDQYEAMVESGILTARDRMVLINGCLVEKMTHSPPHAIADELCGDALRALLPAGWSLRTAKPIRIRRPAPERDSEPEPDRCIVRGTTRDYEDQHPEPKDVALAVEVSKSSLALDRKMAGIYGRAGIPIYWLIDAVNRQVEVYSQPGPSGYGAMEVLAPGHVLIVIIDGVEVGKIPIEDILPRKRP